MTDGKSEDVSPANNRSFSLEELQKLVGGYIELIRLPLDKSTMVVNEEGLLHDLPFNSLASSIAGRHVVGNVVILTAAEMRAIDDACGTENGTLT